MSELEEADKIFKELMKYDSGKIILAFLFICMAMPKEEFDKFINCIKENNNEKA